MTETNGLILLIEDDQQTRRFLRSNLGGRGWRIAEAEAGKPGLAMAKAE